MENKLGFELITSVDLSYEGQSGKPVFQFLYGSQLYGTLFGIYGNFKTVKNGNDMLIKEIDFQLINYKGMINIGFTPNKIVYNDDADKIFYLKVQEMQTERKHRCKLKDPIKITSGNRMPITFHRIVYPLQGFEFPVDESGVKTGGIRERDVNRNMKLFDVEFNYRDGTFLRDRNHQKGMYGEDIDPEKRMLLASPRCHQSYVNLFYK